MLIGDKVCKNTYFCDEIKDLYGFETAALVSMPEVVEHLYNKEVAGKVVINDELKERIDEYYAQYGVK